MAKNFWGIRTKPERERRRRKEKGSQSMRARQEAVDRHSMKRAELGRMTEDRVECLLAKKLEAGDIIAFRRFPPNSPEDAEGDDFEVTQQVGERVVSARFGVTCSIKSHLEYILLRPGKRSIVIPPEMRDERIWWRIQQILREKAEGLGS